MADRTHSHDTSTPAMSAETVPSEEFVLNAMAKELLAHAEFGFTDGANKAGAYEAAKAVWAVALSASHLAKEGGEAGAVDWLWWGRGEADKEHVSFGRWQQHPCQHRYKLAAIQPTEHDHPAASPSGCDAEAQHLRKKLDHHFNLRVKAEDDLKAERKAHDRTRVALEYANIRISVMQTTEHDLTQPSPALAKGGDAVRVVLTSALKAWDECPDYALPSTLIEKAAILAEAARAVLSTPTEESASQPEVIGTTYDGVDVLAPAVPSSNFTREEARSAVAAAMAVPAPQTEGMGGEVNEAAEREAFEKWWPKHWPNAGSVSDNVWQGWMGRAALTPPETAEAVPVAYAKSREKPWGMGDNMMWADERTEDWMLSTFTVPLYAHPVPEAARLREALKDWDDCPDHAFPSTVVEKAAGLAEAVRAALAARSASSQGGE